MTEAPAPRGVGPAADPVFCPYLGLADDPATHFAFATIAHRCGSPRGPREIGLTYQASVCLAANYPTCRRFSDAPPRPEAGLSVAAARGAPALDRVAGPARATGRTGRRRRFRVSLAVVVVAVFAIAAVAGWLMTRPSAPPAGGAAASPSASPVVSPGASTTRSPSSTPSSAASPRPTSTPGTSPTDATPAPIIHAVVRGETLSSIANRYGVTIAAIQEANGLADPNYIVGGQRLIIPPP